MWATMHAPTPVDQTRAIKESETPSGAAIAAELRDKRSAPEIISP